MLNRHSSVNRGFTLIELLIAMLVMSLVMYIGSLSFSTFSQRWQKDIGNFNYEVNKAKNLMLLEKMLRGVSNYIVKNDNDEMIYFFKGNAKYLLFVTNNPLLNPKSPALVRLSVTVLQNGKQQLKYEEASFEHSSLINAKKLPQPHFTKVLFTDDNIRFNFYGWENQNQRAAFFERVENVTPKWLPEYFAEKTGMLPYAINITWAENEPIIFPLANDNAYQLMFSHNVKDNG
ncbi:Tfp pilus assembly protein FimT/FimU [uncultured Shewanella sp.]|uniref:Tfp pilus assembly protein FimT/FimU n=1 Tax=uncultured Shewanella sp. TaxID=173975 RepID=UPI003703EE78